jgi:hypothetical protein
MKILKYVQEFEATENIVERWKETDERWCNAQAQLDTRQYCRALDELSRLVVQRLFELEKMGVGGTGRY